MVLGLCEDGHSEVPAVSVLLDGVLVSTQVWVAVGVILFDCALPEHQSQIVVGTDTYLPWRTWTLCQS